ncbi:MAG: hypothetical protein JWO06_3453 [Bacteroidota bacterium]|nr:hypothetical protein [Bacteroidota bacterium]
MKSAVQLNWDILKISNAISEKFPELSEYIGELPVKILESNSEAMNIKYLTDHYNALNTLLKNYTACFKARQDKSRL